MIVIDKWAGLVTNASQYALPVGAAVEQTNLQTLSPGHVVVRPGNAVVSWGISSSTAGQIATAIRYQHGTTENVVFQDVSGSIYIAKNPT
jgi:hypothetical protein